MGTEDRRTLPYLGRVIWYTDGSENDKGTGVGIFGMIPKLRDLVEIYAIILCVLEKLERQYERKSIFICIDSQKPLRPSVSTLAPN